MSATDVDAKLRELCGLAHPDIKGFFCTQCDRLRRAYTLGRADQVRESGEWIKALIEQHVAARARELEERPAGEEEEG